MVEVMKTKSPLIPIPQFGPVRLFPSTTSVLASPSPAVSWWHCDSQATLFTLYLTKSIF